MAVEAFQTAKEAAFDLIRLYGQDREAVFNLIQINEQDRVRFARRPALRNVGSPDQLILQALSESQRLLNRASEQALLKKIAFLRSARNRQLAINCVHLITGSAFVLQIAGSYPSIIKWVGAFLALTAGVISLLLPRNMASLEQEVFKDTSSVASLIGEIGRLQVVLAIKPASQDEKLAREVADVIGRCMALAKKYNLENIAAKSRIFPQTQITRDVSQE